MRDTYKVEFKAVVSDQLVAPLNGPVQRSPSDGAVTVDVLSATLTVTVPIVLPEVRPHQVDPPPPVEEQGLEEEWHLAARTHEH